MDEATRHSAQQTASWRVHGRRLLIPWPPDKRAWSRQTQQRWAVGLVKPAPELAAPTHWQRCGPWPERTQAALCAAWAPPCALALPVAQLCCLTAAEKTPRGPERWQQRRGQSAPPTRTLPAVGESGGWRRPWWGAAGESRAPRATAGAQLGSGQRAEPPPAAAPQNEARLSLHKQRPCCLSAATDAAPSFKET